MPDWETLVWPRAQHLHRVFQVKSGNNTGTAFAIDVDGRQYLVSALHVVETSIGTASLEIYREKAWRSFPFDVVGLKFDADVAVYALKERIVGPNLDIEISSAGCVAGQEVFSWDIHWGSGDTQQGLDFPLR
jgi:S1-C subfamily serine protease